MSCDHSSGPTDVTIYEAEEFLMVTSHVHNVETIVM